MPYKDPAKAAAYYLRHRKKKATQKAERAQERRRIIEWHLGYGCRDCGELDPVVLQFDHVYGPRVNRGGVHFAAWNYGLQRFLDELAKCEVRCANCHLRRHANGPVEQRVGRP